MECLLVVILNTQMNFEIKLNRKLCANPLDERYLFYTSIE